MRAEGLRARADFIEYRDRDAEMRNFDIRQSEGNLRVRGARATITDGNVLRAHDAAATTCPAVDEDWKITADEIVADWRDNQARAYGARFYLSGLPIFYLPYTQFVVDSRRKPQRDFTADYRLARRRFRFRLADLLVFGRRHGRDNHAALDFRARLAARKRVALAAPASERRVASRRLCRRRSTARRGARAVGFRSRTAARRVDGARAAQSAFRTANTTTTSRATATIRLAATCRTASNSNTAPATNGCLAPKPRATAPSVKSIENRLISCRAFTPSTAAFSPPVAPTREANTRAFAADDARASVELESIDYDRFVWDGEIEVDRRLGSWRWTPAVGIKAARHLARGASTAASAPSPGSGYATPHASLEAERLWRGGVSSGGGYAVGHRLRLFYAFAPHSEQDDLPLLDTTERGGAAALFRLESIRRRRSRGGRQFSQFRFWRRFFAPRAGYRAAVFFVVVVFSRPALSFSRSAHDAARRDSAASRTVGNASFGAGAQRRDFDSRRIGMGREI